MNNVKESIIVAFAFVGVVVGAGFATGQEIFQFFTSHGIYSIGGIFITGLILTLGGIFVLNTGFRLRSQNHSESIRYYLHRSSYRCFRRGNTISCGSRSNDCSVLLYYR